jgi:hypothetical protein
MGTVEQIAINVVVPVLEKYRLPPVPALGHVMRKAANHHAGKARHLGKLPQRKENGDRYHVDASPFQIRVSGAKSTPTAKAWVGDAVS